MPTTNGPISVGIRFVKTCSYGVQNSADNAMGAVQLLKNTMMKNKIHKTIYSFTDDVFYAQIYTIIDDD